MSAISTDVLVIGGGAAGFFAAIACAEDNPKRRVTLAERTSHVLGKVKISGGGRCNVTHACFDPARLVTFYPRGGQALRGPFSRFQPRDTITWFERRGVALKTEADGRVFPTTDDSQTILDCLTTAARHAGVTLKLYADFQTLRPAVGGGFDAVSSDGHVLHAKRVILATGSNPQGWEWARALGHTLIAPVPSLFTFTIPDPRLDGLAGLSVPHARVTLEVPGTSAVLAQEGALLVTHWGLSGPAILKLSAWGARALHAVDYRANLRVQWDGTHTLAEWTEALRQARGALGKKTFATSAGPVPLPQRLWTRLATAANLLPTTRWGDATNEQLARLAEEIQNGGYRMRGKSTFKEEFVTCGGVHLDDVDFRTMESKRQPGLYFAGEVLDVDAVTGGFNFQNAWTTGWLAGHAAAQT